VLEIIDSKYQIRRTLGKGGCGTVYVAWHEPLQKEVAVKVLSVKNPESTDVKRFQQEAHALTACNHPSIVRIHAFGITEDRLPYFVMDYIDGTSLATELKENGPLPPARFAGIFEQILSALQHAHSAGLIHRDIKPSNIMLTKDGGVEHATIIDFGMTRFVESEVKLTATNALIGTPYYMSPEQCTGGKVDQRSDLYSLGCTMLEAATGKLPFNGEAFEVLIAHISAAPDTVPKELVPLLEGCMAKDPEKRFPNAIAALTTLQSLGLDRFEQFSTGKHSLQKSEAEQSPQSIIANREAAKRLTSILAGVLVLCILGIAAFVYSSQSESPPSVPGARTADLLKAANEEAGAHHWKDAARDAKTLLESSDVHLGNLDRLKTIRLYVDSARNAGFGLTDYKIYLDEGIRLAEHFSLPNYERQFYQRRGQEYSSIGDRTNGEADLKKAVAIADVAPNNWEDDGYTAYYLYANWLLNWGDPEAALQMLTKEFDVMVVRNEKGFGLKNDDEKNMFELLTRQPLLKSHPDFAARADAWLESHAQTKFPWTNVDRLVWAAGIVAQNGKLDKARALLEKAYSLAHPVDPVLTAFVLHSYNSVLPLTSQEKLSKMQEALRICERERSNNQAAYVTALEHVAAAYDNLGDNAQCYKYRVQAADEYHKMALQFDEKQDTAMAWMIYDSEAATRLFAVYSAKLMHDQKAMQRSVDDCLELLSKQESRDHVADHKIRLQALRGFLAEVQKEHSTFRPPGN
jgi:serine/threonine protein kinase